MARDDVPASIKRIEKEIRDLEREKQAETQKGTTDKTIRNFEINRLSPDNMFEWEAYLTPHEGSVYEGGVFNIRITFPTEYPFKPPKIVFMTKIYHPNINNNGVICLDILQDGWSPALTISKVIISLLSWLDDPNDKDPLVPEIGRLHAQDRETYNKKCREYVKKYAMPPDRKNRRNG